MKECINEMVSEGQLPHKIFNLLYSKLIIDNKSTMLGGGGDFLKPFNLYILSDETLTVGPIRDSQISD